MLFGNPEGKVPET